MDHQQGFLVGVSSGGRPIEAPRDYCFVVDHGKFVVQLVARSVPDWVLWDAQGIRARVQAALTHRRG